MSSSDEIGGASASSRMRPADSRTRLRSKGPARTQGRSQAAATDDEREYDSCKCFLCLEPLLSAATKRVCGKEVHLGACWNAIRCYKRFFEGKPDLQKEANRRMQEEPGAWRAEVLPLRCTDGPRDAGHRSSLKRKIVEVKEQYAKEECVNQSQVMNKKRFTSYHKFWDGYGSDTCSSEFEEALKKQGGRYSTSTEAMVLVKDNMLIRSVTGASSSIATHEVAPMGGDDDDAPAASSARSSRPERRPDQARHSRHSRRRSREGRRARRRDGGAMDSVGAPGDSTDDVGTPLGQRRRMRSPYTPHGPPPPTPPALTPRTPRAPPPDAPSPIAASSSAAPASSNSIPDSAARMTPRQYMEAKAALRQSMMDTLATCAGGRAVTKRIATAVAKLPQARVGQLEQAPQTIIDAVDAAKSALEELQQRCETIKSDAFDNYKSDCVGAIGALRVKLAHAEGEYEAIQFLLNEEQRFIKGQRNHSRYAKNKFIGFLVKGGFGKVHAEAFVRNLSQERPQADGFNIDRACIFKGGLDEPHPVAQRLNSAISADKESLANKKTMLKGMLDGEKSHWGGAVMKLELAADSLGKVAEMEFVGNEPGMAPWICALRQFAWRFGPASAPLPGIGALIANRSEKLEVVLQILPVQPLLANGIAIGDMGMHLESPSGGKFFSEQCAMLTLAPLDCAWVPFGYVCVPCAINEVDSGADDAKKAAATDYGYLVYWHLFDSQVAAQSLDPNTWAAVEKWNGAHLQKQASSRLWGARLQSWEKFAKAVGDLITT